MNRVYQLLAYADDVNFLGSGECKLNKT